LGDYYGELRLSRYKKPVPHGCGLHYCKDKTYLGYLENGSWVIGSERLVATSLYYHCPDDRSLFYDFVEKFVEKKDKEAKVCMLIKARPNGKTQELELVRNYYDREAG